MKEALLHRVIADQSNRSLLELHSKAEVARTCSHDDFLGPCMDFLVTSRTGIDLVFLGSRLASLLL